MSSCKSAQRHDKVLQDKGLRFPLCYLGDRWQMNGLTSCFLKGTCGPPSLPKGLPQRWLRKKPFAKNGADCRPSTCGWTSRLAGICCWTVCIRRLPLGLVSNYMTCLLREPPRRNQRKHGAWSVKPSRDTKAKNVNLEFLVGGFPPAVKGEQNQKPKNQHIITLLRRVSHIRQVVAVWADMCLSLVLWKLGLVGVDLLDDGVTECWAGVSLFCLFLERIDSHCVCFEENQFRFCFRLRSSVFRSLLSLAKLRLEEVWKSFTEHTKCVDVWLKNDSEKGP